MAPKGGLKQRRLSVVTTNIDIGTVFYQKANYLYMDPKGGPMQRRLFIDITSTDIGTVFY